MAKHDDANVFILPPVQQPSEAGWLQLHKIAAARGDGLRPEFRALLEQPRRIRNPAPKMLDNVVPLRPEVVRSNTKRLETHG